MAVHEISAVLRPASALFRTEQEEPPLVKSSKCKYGEMMYFPHDFYIGGSLDLYGEYGEDELAINLSYINPGDFVIEVGSNIGTHTVPMAKHITNSGRLIAFEPQRILYQMLCGNLALNALWNVYAFQCGLGEGNGMMTVPPVDYSAKSNFGAVELSDQPGEPVLIEKLDSYNLPACDFIKIDVEGMEEKVLRGGEAMIAKYRPVMSVENDRKEKSESLVKYLRSLNYDLYWSITPLFSKDNFKGNAENVFGGVHSFNMVCLPRERNFVPRLGLKAVE